MKSGLCNFLITASTWPLHLMIVQPSYGRYNVIGVAKSAALNCTNSSLDISMLFLSKCQLNFSGLTICVIIQTVVDNILYFYCIFPAYCCFQCMICQPLGVRLLHFPSNAFIKINSLILGFWKYLEV